MLGAEEDFVGLWSVERWIDDGAAHRSQDCGLGLRGIGLAIAVGVEEADRGKREGRDLRSRDRVGEHRGAHLIDEARPTGAQERRVLLAEAVGEPDPRREAAPLELAAGAREADRRQQVRPHRMRGEERRLALTFLAVVAHADIGDQVLRGQCVLNVDRVGVERDLGRTGLEEEAGRHAARRAALEEDRVPRAPLGERGHLGAATSDPHRHLVALAFGAEEPADLEAALLAVPGAGGGEKAVSEDASGIDRRLDGGAAARLQVDLSLDAGQVRLDVERRTEDVRVLELPDLGRSVEVEGGLR